MEIGDENVIIGAPYITKAGNRNVVLGATDLFGNCKYTQPMAIGYGAKAGPGSIVIGANAGAGIQTDRALAPTASTD
jgi:hypothetical protein